MSTYKQMLKEHSNNHHWICRRIFKTCGKSRYKWGVCTDSGKDYMDQCMADVIDFEKPEIGDEVVLFGSQMNKV